MRISELSRTTGLTVATIKFYLRQQLMPPGTPVTATQSEYGPEHIDRLRLIRALVDVGGLPLTSVRAILRSLEPAPTPTPGDAGSAAAGGAADEGAVAADPAAGGAADEEGSAADPAAGGAATGDGAGGGAPGGGSDAAAAVPDLARIVSDVYESLPPVYPPTDRAPQRALATMKWLGWGVNPGSVALRQLEEALTALESLGMTPTPAILQRYADAAEQVARAEVSGVPGDSATEALRYVVVGTVMYEPVLIALRRLAHQHLFTEGTTRPPRR